MKSQPIIDTFTLSPDGKSITCKRCKFTSYNPNDVDKHYCGHCHVFHDDLWPPAREWWINHPMKHPLETAAELVLLFHSGSPWDLQKQTDWDNAIGRIWALEIPDGPLPKNWNKATTKNLCDALRRALKFHERNCISSSPQPPTKPSQNL